MKSSGQRPTKSLIPVTTSMKDIIEMNDSHQCDSTLNGHNPSFQAGGTPNRHHWHPGIVAQSADGRNLSHLSIEASMFPLLVHLLPGLWPDHSLWRFPSVRPGILAVLGANIEPGCNPVNPEDGAEVSQEAGSQLCCGL